MRASLLLLFFIISHLSFAQPAEQSYITPVNSSYDELNPVLSPDGQRLFFTIANHPDNIGGKKDPGDIWFSKLIDDQWSSPIHGGERINDRSFNAVGGITHDGSLFILNHFSADGSTAKTQGISFCQRSPSGWSTPKNIAIPYFQNKSNLICGTLSADGKVLIYSAETYGTRGVDDLYVTLKENDQWSEPKNLGSLINTQFQELSPSLSDDKSTLYFSTNGRKGKGSFDVYASTRLDESWTNWSEPVNLGDPVNTEARELFYQDLELLNVTLFTRTESSDGYGVIKMHKGLPIVDVDSTQTITQNETDSAMNVASPVIQPENPGIEGITVRGRVTNAATGEPVTSTLLFGSRSLTDPKSVVSSTDGYEVVIPTASVYTIRIESSGYVSALEKLDVNTLPANSLELNFKLQPAESGTTVNLRNVLFAQGSTDLLPESFDELDLVVSFLRQNPVIKIELSGHTDNRGVAHDNLRLSQKRVDTIKKYLVSKGVEAKRISGKGYGGAKPIASNDTEESRRLNRRVDFTIK